MMKSITYVNPHKTALTVSLVFAVSSMIFLIPMGILSSFAPPVEDNGAPFGRGFPIMLMLIMPFFYFVFGYIFTAISCWLYNQVAKYTGGIRLELSEK